MQLLALKLLMSVHKHLYGGGAHLSLVLTWAALVENNLLNQFPPIKLSQLLGYHP